MREQFVPLPDYAVVENARRIVREYAARNRRRSHNRTDLPIFAILAGGAVACCLCAAFSWVFQLGH